MIDTQGNVDDQGWQYGSNFALMRYPPGKGAETRGPLDVVRRRRLRRVRHRTQAQPESEAGPPSGQQPTPIADVSESAMQASQAASERQVLGQVAPGDLIALPMGWNTPGELHDLAALGPRKLFMGDKASTSEQEALTNMHNLTLIKFQKLACPLAAGPSVVAC